MEDCAYRPFDTRRTIFDRNVVSILRDAVMQQLRCGPNLALLTSRVVNDADYAHAFVCNLPVDKIFLSSKTSTNAYAFPLYLYDRTPIEEQIGGRLTKRPNLARGFVTRLADQLGCRCVPEGRGKPPKTFGPEDVLGYVYAILHSPTYRERYREFLVGDDFPRIPVLDNVDLFFQLANLGLELISLHILHTPILAVCENPLSSPVGFPEPGDNLVESGHPKYLAPGDRDPLSREPLGQGRVYISRPNKNTGEPGQFFEGIMPEVWEFRIGGYHVCEKWLKDRRRRQLSDQEIVHYQKIVMAVGETIRFMAEIDELIPEWPIA